MVADVKPLTPAEQKQLELQQRNALILSAKPELEPLPQDYAKMYLAYINTLETRLAQYQKLHSQLSQRYKSLQHEFDVDLKHCAAQIQFTKQSLMKRQEDVLQAQKEVEKMQREIIRLKHKHTLECERQTAKYDKMQKQYQIDIEKLSTSLADIEAWSLKRSTIEKNCEIMQHKLVENRENYETKLNYLLWKSFDDKHKLLQQVARKMVRMANEFRKEARDNMPQTTKRMVEENGNISQEMNKLSTSMQNLIEENVQFHGKIERNAVNKDTMRTKIRACTIKSIQLQDALQYMRTQCQKFQLELKQLESVEEEQRNSNEFDDDNAEEKPNSSEFVEGNVEKNPNSSEAIVNQKSLLSRPVTAAAALSENFNDERHLSLRAKSALRHSEHDAARAFNLSQADGDNAVENANSNNRPPLPLDKNRNSGEANVLNVKKRRRLKSTVQPLISETEAFQMKAVADEAQNKANMIDEELQQLECSGLQHERDFLTSERFNSIVLAQFEQSADLIRHIFRLPNALNNSNSSDECIDSDIKNSLNLITEWFVHETLAPDSNIRNIFGESLINTNSTDPRPVNIRWGGDLLHLFDYCQKMAQLEERIEERKTSEKKSLEKFDALDTLAGDENVVIDLGTVDGDEAKNEEKCAKFVDSKFNIRAWIHKNYFTAHVVD